MTYGTERPARSAATYRNPILNADWPDLDAIRVGEKYYLVASSINRVPGLPILVSNDLVNWRHLGSAPTALEPREHFAVPRLGAGARAPSLRHHDGVLFLFVPDPDRGVRIIGSPVTVIDGDDIAGYSTLEGPRRHCRPRHDLRLARPCCRGGWSPRHPRRAVDWVG